MQMDNIHYMQYDKILTIFSKRCKWFFYSPSRYDFLIFKDGGMVFLSNLVIDSRPCNQPQWPEYVDGGPVPMFATALAMIKGTFAPVPMTTARPVHTASK